MTETKPEKETIMTSVNPESVAEWCKHMLEICRTEPDRIGLRYKDDSLTPAGARNDPEYPERPSWAIASDVCLEDNLRDDEPGPWAVIDHYGEPREFSDRGGVHLTQVVHVHLPDATVREGSVEVFIAGDDEKGRDALLIPASEIPDLVRALTTVVGGAVISE